MRVGGEFACISTTPTDGLRECNTSLLRRYISGAPLDLVRHPRRSNDRWAQMAKITTYCSVPRLQLFNTPMLKFDYQAVGKFAAITT